MPISEDILTINIIVKTLCDIESTNIIIDSPASDDILDMWGDINGIYAPPTLISQHNNIKFQTELEDYV